MNLRLDSTGSGCWRVAEKALPERRQRRRMSFAAPYLALMTEQAPQRQHLLQEVFNALRWIARAGAPWRLLPNDFPPWEAVYQQTRRWLEAGCFEHMVSDLRSVLRSASGRRGQPSAVVPDGRTLQSSYESGTRAGYAGYKRKKGSKVHMAVDTLGHLLAVHVTPADEQERAQVDTLCEAVQAVQAVRATRCALPGLTRATRARNPDKTPRPTASSCESSSCPRRRKASCCCRGAGSSSAAFPWLRAVAGSPETTSGCPM